MIKLNRFFLQVTGGLKIFVTKYKIQVNKYKETSTGDIPWMYIRQVNV